LTENGWSPTAGSPTNPNEDHTCVLGLPLPDTEASADGVIAQVVKEMTFLTGQTRGGEAFKGGDLSPCDSREGYGE